MRRTIRVLQGGLALALSSVAHAAPCDAEGLTSAAAQAQDAFVGMDGASFTAAAAAVRDGVGCQTAPLPPEAAAQVHVVGALQAFLDRDESRTIAAFQAARAAHPDLSVDGWLPEQHPIHLEWRMAARLEEDAPLALDVSILADGTPSDAVVPSRPAVLQNPAGSGPVSASVLWQPGEDLPDWAPLAPVRLSADAKRRIWLGSATIAAAAASGTLLAFSSRAREQYLDTSTNYNQLADLEQDVHVTSVGAIASGAVALGFGATLAMAW